MRTVGTNAPSTPLRAFLLFHHPGGGTDSVQIGDEFRIREFSCAGLKRNFIRTDQTNTILVTDPSLFPQSKMVKVLIGSLSVCPFSPDSMLCDTLRSRPLFWLGTTWRTSPFDLSPPPCSPFEHGPFSQGPLSGAFPRHVVHRNLFRFDVVLVGSGI
jgi:hypothetical protein